jgi:hypothetical protein
VPRQKIAKNDDMPHHSGTDAGAFDGEPERGFAMSLFLRRPKDVLAGALAFAAVAAIVANALFLQAGRHPSPMFGSVVPFPVQDVAVASPLPRPRPAEATLTSADTAVDEVKPVISKAPARTDTRIDARGGDPLTNLVRATSGAPANSANVPRPPAPVPVSVRSEPAATPATRRVAAVQRALTEYGYGQLKPTGTVGSDTQAAIQKFERDRKLPVTGQVSDRLLRELAVVIGHPVG